MKKVLVLYYTQSGQLLDIAKNVVSELQDADDVEVSYYNIEPAKSYDFPWQRDQFFDAFPESFLQIPCELKPVDSDILNADYDLVILAYQIWYLTPSIPVNSFLRSDKAKQLLEDKPVITLIGCRNMWVQAQEKMKLLLSSLNAKLVGNIVLADRHLNHISVITISKWMFSGKKKRYLGIFPKPGVSDKDINEAIKFGKPILESTRSGSFDDLQSKLLDLEAVNIKPFLVLADKRANILFSKWANFIIKKGKAGDPKRLKWIKVFKNYLLFAIWVIAPIVFIVFLLTYPFSIRKIERQKEYYKSVSQK